MNRRLLSSLGAALLGLSLLAAPSLVTDGSSAAGAVPARTAAVAPGSDGEPMAARSAPVEHDVRSLVAVRAQLQHALDALSPLAAVPDPSPPVRGYPQGVITQGAAMSGATVWQAAGRQGAGVSIAIIDGGFKGLGAERAAGNLPNAGLSYWNVNCLNGGGDVQHGTAVAEIVHQMAPAATLYLYCVYDTAGFAAAANDIIAKRIPIATSSLGFPGDSRGDGTGAQGSAADTVHKAAEAGVFWIQSAGNNAREHWSGTLVDADSDKKVDLGCVYGLGGCKQADAVFVPAGGTASVTLRWDQWPTSPFAGGNVILAAYGYQCDAVGNCTTPINPDVYGQPSGIANTHAAGTAPTITLDIPNTSTRMQRWDIVIGADQSRPGTAFDLSYWGDVDDPSYLAFLYPDQAAQGSITEPASSPNAFAVGAAAVQARSGILAGQLEPYSSRGPTVDGRTKPEILGWDCVGSNLAEYASGFCGTSASAPHVAGAAALALAADPSLTRDRLATFLQARANDGVPFSPIRNGEGAGVLTLGFFDVSLNNPFFDQIAWLSQQGITKGYADGGFHPGEPIDRQAMAAFFYRLVTKQTTAPPCVTRPFADVAVDSQFCGAIAWFKDQQITKGYPDGTFHPADAVDRQAMAAFIYRLVTKQQTAPACVVAPFADVAVSDEFCGEIDWFSGQGITTGYPDRTYHPADPVDRQAMAAFLYRLAPKLP